MNTTQQRSEAQQIPNIAGKVMTVRGPIDPGQVGVTLMHEHVFVDIRKGSQPNFYTPATEVALWDQNRKITLETLHLAREGKPFRESGLFSDEKLATAEAVYFRDVGGNTIVDCASTGIRRDPLALRRVSYATGINIVMGSGWYQKQYHPDDMDQRTVEDLTDEIVRDITVGVGETGIRSGIIGEVGVDGNPITPNEVKSIQAAARASRATGAAITLHRSGHGRDEKLQVVGIIGEEGGDLTRTILGHSDFIAMELPLMKELLELGPYIEFDLLGKLDVGLVRHPPIPARAINGWSISAVVAEAVIDLIAAGYEDRILISHDCFPRHNLRSYGGTGWAFIIKRFLPHLRSMGVIQEQINKIMVENPRRALTFVAPG